MSEFQSYVLCTSPRSGSTLLCKILAETGVAGHPKSYFHKSDLGDWASYLGVSLSAETGELGQIRLLVDAAIEQGTANTGLFGLRLQRHSFDFFFRQLRTLCLDEPTDKDRLEAVFGRTLFVHLTRPDKLSQAVSYVKAQQSGLWHRAADGSELERLSPPADPVFDFEALKDCRDQFIQFDRDWNDWFAEQAIEPLRLSYDDLCADPQTELKRVLTALDLPPSAADPVQPGVAKLADSINADWIKRFQDQAAAGS
ncbi:sulfotransferase [Labrenzia sp. R4_1]|uniref:Stf0 family sulfotransferase n=1 Tax=Labrenzia sp. R4_1 TaxID=2821106 RepID=UPI001ADB5530|nr:Stf0 family sulfotransferase [Labrenzia sp. R4_1]MBO9424226.1 sulfotransferase [Labrenzia sp. R4_1]